MREKTAFCLLFLALPYLAHYSPHPMTTMAFHHVARISWRTSSTRLMPQRPKPTLGTMAFFSSTSSNSNKDDKTFEREFIQKQKLTSADTVSKATSDSINSNATNNNNSDPQRRHNDHQARMFDEMASFFSSHEAVPEKVVPILRDMSNRMMARALERRAQGHAQDQVSRPARANTTYNENVLHILDVGCGSGVLFDFFLQTANSQGVTVHITGADLSTNMVEQARLYANELLSRNSNNKHSISVQVGDICNRDGTITTSRSDTDEPQQQQQQVYDLVVANACFGNFWDRSLALEQMAKALNLHGLLCITHPLGSEFVRQLHQEDPQTVPYLLPTTTNELQQLARTLPLRVLDIVDKNDNNDSDNNGYHMATAVKVVYRTLPQTMRLRGRVDTGYGRGGKKLGFPTANLPSRLFQGALQDVPCGVYFGWAVLEDNDNDTKKKGRNVLHKAVVNVGYSPTFEGQENPEKIVEAHLIFLPDQSSSPPLDPPDFYGEVMRLQLHGFIRTEMKFPSFPALIAQISTDVQDAKDALDWEFYQQFQKDLFLSSSTSTSLSSVWIGSGGGDEDASWEFEDVESVLKRL